MQNLFSKYKQLQFWGRTKHFWRTFPRKKQTIIFQRIEIQRATVKQEHFTISKIKVLQFTLLPALQPPNENFKSMSNVAAPDVIMSSEPKDTLCGFRDYSLWRISSLQSLGNENGLEFKSCFSFLNGTPWSVSQISSTEVYVLNERFLYGNSMLSFCLWHLGNMVTERFWFLEPRNFAIYNSGSR